MKILLTNDDGYTAEGIRALYKALCKEHEVIILAPKGNQSGKASSIHLFSDLLFEKHEDSIYSLDGSPTDCVMVAMKGELIEWSDGRTLPDLLLSGINHGANIGTDTMYSGTLGAARQGALYGVPSIGLSLEKLDWESPVPFEFDVFASFVARNLQRLIDLNPARKSPENCRECFKPMDSYLNINAPSLKEYKGIRYTSLCHRNYQDIIQLVKKEDGEYTRCIGNGVPDSMGDADNDWETVRAGCVSVSVLKTHTQVLMPAQNLDEKAFFTL